MPPAATQEDFLVKFYFWKEVADNSLFIKATGTLFLLSSTLGVKTSVDEEFFTLTYSATSSDIFGAQLNHSDALTFSSVMKNEWKIRQLNVAN